MSEAKFTPGPWRAWQPRGDESVPVRTDGLGITIAYVHQGAITNAQANAHLIAAAPELYEALEWLETYAMVQVDRHPDAQDNKGWRNIIAALAKARGEV